MLTARWTPTADLFETKDAFVVRVEVPGLTEKDIDVEIENNVLSVKGERKIEKEAEEKGYRRIERSYGKFLRAFTLPPNVIPEKIAANYANGLLELTIPKKEEAKVKKITLDVKKKLVSAA
jgi:HSP20 family protein